MLQLGPPCQRAIPASSPTPHPSPRPSRQREGSESPSAVRVAGPNPGHPPFGQRECGEAASRPSPSGGRKRPALTRPHRTSICTPSRFCRPCQIPHKTTRNPADLSAALSVLRPTETPPFSTCFASNSLALRGSDLAKLISRSSCSGVIFVGAPDRDRSDNDSSPSFSHAVRVDPTVLGCTPIASATSFVDKPSLSSRIVSARSRWRQLLPRRTMFVSVDRHRSSS
jgi:hypothetical protein